MLPMFSVVPYFNSACFNKNPSMRAVAKILPARGREKSFNFSERFEQRPNFASTYKVNGSIRA